jgi:hypothetical protein
VTDAPAQTGLADANIDTLTGKLALTDMLIMLEVAGLPLTQPSVEVIRTLRAAPFTSVVDV